MGLCKCMENGKVTVSQHLVLTGYVTPYVIAPHVCEVNKNCFIFQLDEVDRVDEMKSFLSV